MVEKMKTCICEKFPLSFNNELYEFIKKEKRDIELELQDLLAQEKVQ